nr:hypothetical protein [uncultured Roseococcus sp.]
MSVTGSHNAGPLNIAELVARIERRQEEVRKFAAEQHKLAVQTAAPPIAERVTLIAIIIAAAGGLIAAAPVVSRFFVLC